MPGIPCRWAYSAVSLLLGQFFGGLATRDRLVVPARLAAVAVGHGYTVHRSVGQAARCASARLLRTHLRAGRGRGAPGVQPTGVQTRHGLSARRRLANEGKEPLPELARRRMPEARTALRHVETAVVGEAGGSEIAVE